MLADARGIQCAAAIVRDRIADKIVDRTEHAGDRIGIDLGQIRRRFVMQHQTAAGLDQKQVLNMKPHRVTQYHLYVRHTAAACFDAPTQTLQSQTAFDRLIEIANQVAHGFDDRLAYRGPDHRKQRIDDTLRLLSHRLGEGA
jgi:hypothetical protein